MNRSTWFGLALMLSGCTVVSDQHLQSFGDGGQPTQDGGGVDAGAPKYEETCLGEGAAPQMIIGDSTELDIDTTGYRDDNSSSCGAVTPGNDAFIAINMQAGQQWHFHLDAIAPADRAPIVYLAKAGSCDPRACQFVANSCAGSDDEHFAFEATESGVWYLGIDDGVAGGGVYQLDAYRLACGDGSQAHGEGCDDGNLEDGDGCDRKCRFELSELRRAEQEPNDNRFEAHALVLPDSNELIVTGSIGGPGACTYGDLFAISVPEMGDLKVDAVNSGDGSECASGATTEFQLALEDATGATVSENMVATNGCAILDETDLPSGEYFVRVRVPNETEIPESYRLRFRILP